MVFFINFYKKYIYNIIGAFFLTSSILSVDLIFSVFNSKYIFLIDFKSMLSVFLLSLFLTFIKNKTTIIIIISIIFFLVFIQLSHFTFFGSLVNPQGIILIFSEMDEIYETLNETLIIFTYPFLSLVFPFLICIYIVLKNNKNYIKIRYISLFFFFLILILPIKAFLSNTSEKFMPKIDSFSLKNIVYASSYFFGKDLMDNIYDHRPTKHFSLYKVNRIDSVSSKNIIIILGESLSYTHMSLFGYEKKTTPRLDKLIQSDSFRYKKAISSAVYTKVSLPMFFNVQREPENFMHSLNKTSNLFTLAKNNNYITHFYSKQKNKLVTNSLSRNDIDHFKSVKDYKGFKYDNILLKELNKIDYNKNNFIVLHQRATHTPYEYNYPKEFDIFSFDKSNYHKYMNNSYDNSILFTDNFISSVIEKIKEESIKNNVESLIFFVPDHGEMLGENGKYGHSVLDINCAKIPFLYYGINTEFTKYIDDYNTLFTHYDISKLVAKSIGYEIINPNDDFETIYINGTGLMGEAGYLELKRNKLIEELKDN
jgi:glucan phosphoethanolaminetransferase (alkaline phosphatase superfamily)